MVTVKTPYRVSFAGGGTDLLEYSRKSGGAIVGCAINKYVTVSLDKGKLTSHSDLASCSGLGGSAAYFSSEYRAKNPTLQKSEVIQYVTTKEQLGQQDQILCVSGGLRAVSFNTDDSYMSTQIPVPTWLNSCMSIYYMGNRKVEGKSLLTGIDEDALREQKVFAQLITKDLISSDFDAFVYHMQEAWESKKKFRPDFLNAHTIDFEKRLDRYGILAFKLCGAGGGGYALLIHDPYETLPLGIPIKVDLAGQVYSQGI